MELNQVNEAKAVYLTTGDDIPETKNSEYLFSYRLTVGRIAENLIQELFLVENFQTYKYGLENTYQGLYKQLRGNHNPAAKSIRKSPDLILFNPCTETLNYAEVKFRSDGKFSMKSSEYQNYEQSFPDCYLFVVTPSQIHSIPFIDMQEMKAINCEKCDDYLLKNSTHFGLRKKSVEHFEKFASVFFNNEFLKQNSYIKEIIS